MFQNPQPISGLTSMGMLFAENFDDPPGVTILDDIGDAAAPGNAAARSGGEPAAAAPAIDIEAERAVAFAQGRLDALSEIAAAAAEQRQEQTRLLGEIAALLRAAEAKAEAIAEEQATAIAKLLLGSLGAALPMFCKRFGADEAAAIARLVLPPLRYCPDVSVRVHPDSLQALGEVVATLDERLRERLRVDGIPTMTPGDLRVDWPDGCAVRDVTRLWGEVTAVLAPLGLIDPSPPNPEDHHGR